jgi:hypothetical protein
MLGRMAGANLSDDVALCSQVVAGISRLLIHGGLLRSHELTAVAAAAGLTVTQVSQFARGELVLPPHQTLVLMSAVFDRQRVQQVAAAESRKAGTAAPVPAESSEAGAQEAVKRLGKDFPDWKIRVDGLESIAAGRAKLIWRAEHGGNWPDVAAVSAAELAGKLEQIEVALAAERKQQEDSRRGKRARVV